MDYVVIRNQKSIFIEDINIEDVRDAIKGRIDFMEIKNSDHSIFTYILMTENSFPDPETVNSFHFYLIHDIGRLPMIKLNCITIFVENAEVQYLIRIIRLSQEDFTNFSISMNQLRLKLITLILHLLSLFQVTKFKFCGCYLNLKNIFKSRNYKKFNKNNFLFFI